MIGQTISHYKISAKIGVGGMGSIYLAEDTQLNRPVALKFLPQVMAADSAALARFRREARATAALNHPNIVTIHDVGEYDGTPYIVMEYIEGQALLEHAEEGPRPIAEIIRLVKEILKGLEKAHNAGIIHRDLKPSNIIIDSNGHPKILDFGIAKVSDGENLTGTGLSLGTLAYMAPEQIDGTEIDQRCDIWSVGVLMYEMVTGQRPFEGVRAAGLTYAILSAPAIPMSSLRDDVPEELEIIVSKCLRKKPEERYESVSALLADLRILEPTGSGEFAISGIRPVAPRRNLHKVTIWTGLAIALIAGWFVVRGIREPNPAPGTGRVMIAVLPFENLGTGDQEYFSDGMTEEIIARLASIRELGVISRKSTVQYKDSDKPAHEIGRELDVEYILGGSIRWDQTSDPQRVRITPQLVRVSDDTQIWADNIERPLQNVFAVQAAIAEEVATALGVSLLEGERDQLEGQGTSDLAAYDYFLRAKEYFNRSNHREDIEIAIDMLGRAVKQDSTFALAYATLSWANCKLYWWGYDPAAERLEAAKQAADRALALAPDMPDAHIAMGYYYYWGFRDYTRALTEFGIAQQTQHSNSDVYEAIGFVERRLGSFDSALAQLRTSLDLDPRSSLKALEIGNTLTRLRRWSEARTYLERARSISPDWSEVYSSLIRLAIYSSGDVGEARRLLAEAGPIIHTPELSGTHAWVEAIAGNYDAALKQLTIVAGDTTYYYIEKGHLYRFAGEEQMARTYYDSARVGLETMINAEPEVSELRRFLGLTFAGLGNNEAAIREAKHALGLLPISKDAFFAGPSNVETLARVYAMVDHADEAIDQLELLLSLPAGLISVPYLVIAPEYQALRSHPRFERLVADTTR